MQKKLIALAIAGLVSAPAFAQSNVTIYGVADVGVSFGSHGDNDLAQVHNGGLSGSRIGFRGTEDLGNGLKALFTYEYGVNFDDGTEGSQARQAFAGLGGNWGSVTFGRQYAPGYDFHYDAVAGSSVLSPQALLSGGDDALTIDQSSGARWDNSVAYNGSFAGLKVRAIYGMGAAEDTIAASAEAGKWADPSDDDRFGLGVEYANGPLKVGAVYHFLKDVYGVTGSDDQQEWLVGGSYNFGVLTLAGSYQDAKNVGFNDGNDADLWQLGVIVPVGAAGNVHVAYGEVDVDDGTFSGKAKSYSLAYTHALSKRTTLYTGWNRTDNDDGMTVGPIDFLDKNAIVNGGDNSDLFAVGVRHTF